MLKKLQVFISALLFIVGAPTQAAVMFYDFAFTETSSGGIPVGSFSGQFEVDGGIIVGISGSGPTLGTINHLYPPGSIAINSSFPPNDNQFSPVPPHLTLDGVTFGTTLFAAVNLYYDLGWFTLNQVSDAWVGVSSGVLSVVPEPGTLALLGLGLAGLAATRRRKQ